MKYTKGEWVVELFNKDRGEKGGYFIGNGEVPIATMTSVPEVKANAHLIAAAPELYEACKALINHIEDPDTGGANRQWRTCYADSLVAKVQDAIAKVVGG